MQGACRGDLLLVPMTTKKSIPNSLLMAALYAFL